MQSYLIGAIACAVIFTGLFYSGRVYERNLQAKVTVKQLQTDAVAVGKIEERAKERETKIVTQVKVIHEKAPEWSDTRLPESVLFSLRDAGIRTQSKPAR